MPAHKKQDNRKKKKKTKAQKSSNSSAMGLGAVDSSSQKQQQQYSAELDNGFEGALSAEQVIERAQELRGKYQFQEAIQLLSQAVKGNHASDTRLLDLLGEIAFEQGDTFTAEKCFTQSVKSKPNDGFNKYMYLGQLHGGANSVQMFTRGIHILEQLKKAIPPHLTLQKIQTLIANGFCSIVDVYMTDLCMQPDAEQQCEKCIALAQREDPESKNINIFQTMASVRISQCRNDDAKLCMQKVLSLYEEIKQHELKDIESNELASDFDKPNYVFRISSAKLLMELHMFQQSEQLLTLLAKEFEKVVDVWYLLGVCCEQMKDYKHAVKHLETALKLATEMIKRGEEDMEFAQEIVKELQLCKKQLAQRPQQQEEDDDSGDDNEEGDDDDDDDAWEDLTEDQQKQDQMNV